MSTASELSTYLPPTFDLYEFDAGGPGDRWFVHWNGLMGEPAGEVILGWSSGDARVLVCSAGDEYAQGDPKHHAACVALVGTSLRLRTRPESPTAVFREIDRIAAADDIWSDASTVAGVRDAQTANVGEFAVGFGFLDVGAVFVAAVGVDPEELRVRRVGDWEPYGIDATTALPQTEVYSRAEQFL